MARFILPYQSGSENEPVSLLAKMAQNTNLQPQKKTPPKRYPWESPAGRLPETNRIEKGPLVLFDREYVPDDLEAKTARQQMLWYYDHGIEMKYYALLLARQEAHHQSQELIKQTFGNLGDCQFLVPLVLDAHLGGESAMDNWLEIAHSAALHLRRNILSDMQKAVDAVDLVLRQNKSAHDASRLAACWFALNHKKKSGVYPTKSQVSKFLDAAKLTLPEPKNRHRFWKGPILGQLKRAKAGRKRAKKLPSRKKSS
jgi:hypothetical protein